MEFEYNTEKQTIDTPVLKRPKGYPVPTNRVPNSKVQIKASLSYRPYLSNAEYNTVTAFNMAVMANLAYLGGDRNIKNDDVLIKKIITAWQQGTRPSQYHNVNLSAVLLRCKKTEDFEHYRFIGSTDGSSGEGAQAFITVSDSQAIIAIRGTQFGNPLMHKEAFKDLLDIDADAKQVDFRVVAVNRSNFFGKGQVHQGFLRQLNEILINTNFVYYLEKGLFKDKVIYICGHSLGGAVAVLLAAYLETQGYDVVVYSFGCPRVGTEEFVKSYGFPHYRHVYRNDLVPKIPANSMNVSLREIATSTFDLPFEKKSKRFPLDTDRDGYLHSGDLYYIYSFGYDQLIEGEQWHGISQERIVKKLHERNWFEEHILNDDPKDTHDAAGILKSGILSQLDNHAMVGYVSAMFEHMCNQFNSYCQGDGCPAPVRQNNLQAIINEYKRQIDVTKKRLEESKRMRQPVSQRLRKEIREHEDQINTINQQMNQTADEFRLRVYENQLKSSQAKLDSLEGKFGRIPKSQRENIQEVIDGIQEDISVIKNEMNRSVYQTTLYGDAVSAKLAKTLDTELKYVCSLKVP